MRAAMVLAILAWLAAPAAAQKTRRVVVAPLAALGTEDTSASAKQIQRDHFGPFL